MTQFREVIYQKDFQESRHCILAGDIGGTNSNFGIFEMQGTKPVLLFSLHAKSQTVHDYGQLVAELVRYCKEKYEIVFEQACFGAAGIIMNDHSLVKPTNLTVAIDAKAIMKASGLKSLTLINDFIAVGVGIDYIAPQDIVAINKVSQTQKHAPSLRLSGHSSSASYGGQGQKACLGAGTGMGKAALVWNKHFKRFLPVASEGGHADCAAQTPLELNLLASIQTEFRQPGCPISWEDVLSGEGIKRIYKFLGTQKKYPETESSKEIAMNGFQPDLISAYALKDERCRATFDMYTMLYARCAKNFVLDMLALNGVYIAGGIAAKNIELFKQKSFYEEFIRCGKHGDILKEVPIFVIADYNVSLYGAVAYILLREQGIV